MPFRQKISIASNRVKIKEGADYLTMEEISAIAADPAAAGYLDALAFFKAITDRKKFIKDALGKNFKTWEDMIPEGYAMWQPREGNVFYMADSVPAQIAKALHEAMAEEMGLKAEDLRKIIAMGGAREQYVIKEELAATLSELDQHEHSWFVEMNRHLLGHWKQLMLVAPRRIIRYNLRNLTGDSDALFVGNPSAFKYAPRAFKELYPIIMKDAKPTGDVADWLDRGGYGSTLQYQEMGDLNNLKAFKSSLMKAEEGGLLSIPAKAWNKYWRTARLGTDLRESILRYAAYLSYLDQIKKGGKPKSYGASIPETVDALPDIRDRAFKLSNEVLGAYDRISVAGQTVRSFWIPFWSWNEVNAKRYWRMARNTMAEVDFGKGVRAGTVGTLKAGRFLIRASALWAMLQVWNNLFFDDEEAELIESNPYQANRPHIIFGRHDGEILYLSGMGALGDLLSWAGLDSLPSMVGDLMHGRLTAGEVAIKTAHAPINKIWQGLTPFVKMPFEMATKVSLYPDVFQPRPINDRAEHMARALTVGREFNKLRGKAGRELFGLKDAISFFALSTDPGRSAFGTWYEIERKWRRRMGRDEKGMYWRTAKGDALKNVIVASREGNEKDEARFRKKYEELGGDDKGMERSLYSQAPLYGLKKEDRDKLLEEIDSVEMRTLERAEAYYMDTVLKVLPSYRRRSLISRLKSRGWLTKGTTPKRLNKKRPGTNGKSDIDALRDLMLTQ